MRAFARPEIDYVVGLMASQVGKTESIFNVLGWMWDGRAVPSMYLSPTEKLARTLARDRLPRMIASVESLADALDRRYSKLGTLEQWINGVRFGMAWAGSETEVSSHPCGMAFVDERSRMANIPGAGDPVRLLAARTKNYPGSKLGIFSSPGEEGICETYGWWALGSKQRWSWECPSCGEWFVPVLEHARYPKKAELIEIKTEAWMECPTCKHEIRDHDREDIRQDYVTHTITEQGQIAQAKGLETLNPIASYWVTGFSSCVSGIGAIMYEYALADRGGDQDAVRASVNTGAGELWKVPGEYVPPDAVKNRRTSVIGDVQRVTVGVDVQQDSLYYRVRGWGAGVTSWGLEYAQLHGATEYDDVWLALQRALSGTFCGRRPDMVLVDSGYNAAQVYEICRRNGWNPAKGHDRQARPFHDSLVDEGPTGRARKTLRLWNYCADTWKQWLYARIQWTEGKPGAWYCEASADDDYCAQVVNERHRLTRGRREWYTTLSRENHYLDCEVLCTVAAHVINVRTLRPLVVDAPDRPDKPPPPSPRPRHDSMRRRGL